MNEEDILKTLDTAEICIHLAKMEFADRFNGNINIGKSHILRSKNILEKIMEWLDVEKT